MRKLRVPRASGSLAVVPLLLALGSCSSAASTTADQTSFPERALQVMACDPDTLQIELRTAPAQPPTAGLDGVEVVLSDPTTHARVEGAMVSLVPWMPLMGHGSDVTPMCSAKGKGRYVCTNVNLYMPGEWQLRFAISAGGTDCRAAPTFDVP